VHREKSSGFTNSSRRSSRSRSTRYRNPYHASVPMDRLMRNSKAEWHFRHVFLHRHAWLDIRRTYTKGTRRMLARSCARLEVRSTATYLNCREGWRKAGEPTRPLSSLTSTHTSTSCTVAPTMVLVTLVRPHSNERGLEITRSSLSCPPPIPRPTPFNPVLIVIDDPLAARWTEHVERIPVRV
jgi:hypothetical protein